MPEETIIGGDAATPVGNSVVTPEVKPQTPETDPAVAPEWGKLCGENGAFAENWKEYLPESLRGEACLANYKTFPTMVQSLVSAQHAMGSGKVAIPNEKSTPEELAAFFKAGGRPDSADGYDFSKVELPQGVSLDENQLKDFRTFAFENGISQKAAAALLAFDIKRASSMRIGAEAEATKEYNETLSRLQNEEGGRFHDLVSHCNGVLSANPRLKNVLDQKGLLNNYEVIRFLAHIGEVTSESTIKGANTGIPVGVDARIAELQSPGSPLHDSNHPQHDAYVAELGRLLASKKS